MIDESPLTANQISKLKVSWHRAKNNLYVSCKASLEVRLISRKGESQEEVCFYLQKSFSRGIPMRLNVWYGDLKPLEGDSLELILEFLQDVSNMISSGVRTKNRMNLESIFETYRDKAEGLTHKHREAVRLSTLQIGSVP